MKKTNAIRLLEKAKIQFNLVEYHYHPDKLELSQIAADNHLELKSVYKTLITKGDKTGPLVAVVPGDQSLNLKKLAACSGNKKIALIPVADLQKTTGYIRGGCSPIALKKPLAVYIDQRVMSLEEVFVNAGTRGLLLGCHPQDLKAITLASIVDIT